MPFGSFGINQTVNITQENITELANFTNPVDFFILVNNVVYNGWLYFVLLLLLWFILFVGAQKKVDQPLNNIMYAGAVITIISFFFRAITMVRNGAVIGLLSDSQMWIFPIITALIAAIVWASREQ